jgi:hypothetical protein
MAVTKISSALGEITTNFLLNDFDVFLMNTSATASYVSTDWDLLGFTSAEKTVNRINEKYRKEAKIPRVQVYSKTIRKSLEVNFDLSNFNEDLLAAFGQGTKSSLGAATGTRTAHGTNEPSLEYRALRFSTTRDDGKTYNITIPKAEIEIGEQTFGGETETVIPLSVKAVFNPAANATASLYTEEMLVSGVNATATVPVGYV